MTVFDPHPTNPINALNGQGDDEILVKLRRWTAQADASADELAQRGGEEREAAGHRLQAAARYDEQAVAARKRADELRVVVAFVEERRRLAASALVDHGPMDGAS